jgi:hypothetical protein
MSRFLASEAALRAHIARTGIGPFTLVKDHFRGQAGISVSLLYTWLHGTAQTVWLDRYSLVLKTWESLPSLDDRYISRTPEIQRVLRDHRKRTGIGIVKLLSQRDDLPNGLTARTMEDFYRDRIRRDHLDYVISLWRALPGSGAPRADP